MSQQANELFDNFQQLTPSEFFRKNKQMLGFTGKIRSLTIVFHELITNSFDAAEEAGILPEINIELKRIDKEHYILRHSDNGPGIRAQDQQIIFERFRQVGDPLTDKPAGTGLGLPISRRIIEHFGGRLWVDSVPGEGATFRFFLPFAPGAGGGQKS